MDDKCSKTMVGLIDSFSCDILLHSRVRVGQDTGTVKYVGEVQGYSGIWVGVEWDDVLRGKHNGQVNGIQYFQTKKPNSGSMIRMSKITKCESLEEAIQNRYVLHGNDGLDENLVREAQDYCGASIFEIVGIEKIAKKQSDIDSLTDVSVAHSTTNCAGNLTGLMNLTVLDLSATLIWNFETLSEITQQIPTLSSLNISSNRFKLPTKDEVSKLEPNFRNLRHINMSKCGLSQWKDVAHLAHMWPMIESLSLEDNAIDAIDIPNTEEIFVNLRELDLNSNNLTDFQQVCKLGNLKTLNSLYIMDNKISSVKFESVSFNEKLSIFCGLNKLNLCDNPLKNEDSLFNEIDKLPSLIALNMTLYKGEQYEEIFSSAVALIQDLQVFNKVRITKEDRRGAECDVWKKYAAEWQKIETDSVAKEKFFYKCRAYLKLLDKYGSPSLYFTAVPLKISNLIKIKICNYDTGESFDKKVPRKMSIQTLQGLIIKYFKRQSTMPSLKYVDSSHPDLVVELDNVSKSLDFYSVQDGDTIIFHW